MSHAPCVCCTFQLPLVLSEGDGNTIEAFNIAHTTAVERLSDLSFIPRSFNPRLEEGGPRKPSRVSKRASTAGAAASPLQVRWVLPEM